MGRSRSKSRDSKHKSSTKDGSSSSSRRSNDKRSRRSSSRNRTSSDHKSKDRKSDSRSSRDKDSRSDRRDHKRKDRSDRSDRSSKASGKKRSRSRSKSRSPKKSRSSSHRSSSSKTNGSTSSKRSRTDSDRKKNTVVKRPLNAPVEGLDELAAKFEQEKIDKEKPVFLTRKQRKELAEKKAKEEKEKATKQSQMDRKLREQFNEEALKARRSAMRDSDKDRGYRSRRDLEHERRLRKESREERERERKKQRQEESQKKELQEIKDQYLVKKHRRKKVVPPSQKFKFSFDWEPTDDTSQDLNPLYKEKASVSLMFGRGYLGGLDPSVQKKRNTVWDCAKENPIQDPAVAAAVARRREERRLREQDKDYLERMENRHWKDKKLDEMTDRDWRIFKEDYNISTRGAALPNPIRYWDESGLPKHILEALKDANYKDPTPIQRMGIPIGLGNRDIVGIAETGSGKTCAFLLPMLVYISKLPPMTQTSALDGPYAVILAPTRELAQQIEHECKKFASRMGIRSVPIVGGVSIETQAFQLRDGAEILIATPGRLNDCLERRYIVLNQCNYIVLDEADRMMDMGFEPQVVSVLDAMPSTNVRPENPDQEEKDHHYRQTIMFSATMPLKVELLTKKYLRNPAYVAIGDRSGQTADRVKQNVHFVSEGAKRKKLMDMLSYLTPPIMVFMNNKKSCDTVSKFLNSQGFNTTSLHGGKIQEKREQAMGGFKDGTIDTLICTNVAGRGIDVKGVTHVINYDMPSSIDDYTHRIGRTGRAGAAGEATSFITSADEDIMYDLKQLLLSSGNDVPSDLARHPAAQSKPGVGKKKKSNVIYAKK